MIEKVAKSIVPISELISQRWSPRAFDSKKLVSRDQILAICEAARWAPSCSGDQPWNYIIWDKVHNLQAYNKGFSCVNDRNQMWVKNCQVLILVTTNVNFRSNGKKNDWAWYDAGAASENICLQATALGLKAHQMAGADFDKARILFKIPENVDLVAFIAIAYQGELDSIDVSFHKNELAERQRLDLGVNFFDSEFGNPII